MKFDICVFVESPSRRSKFHYNMTRITGTLHEDRHTFLITSRSGLLSMRNISDKSCIENQNTHFMVPVVSHVEKYCGAGQTTVEQCGSFALHAE